MASKTSPTRLPKLEGHEPRASVALRCDERGVAWQAQDWTMRVLLPEKSMRNHGKPMEIHERSTKNY